MNRDQKIEAFKGFYVPNSTPVPDNFFDELLAELSGAEVKVVCYVMRRTFGFKRQSDDISISQMLNGIVKRDGTRLDRGTGLSKPTLLRTIRSLKERNVLISLRNSSAERGDEATSYRLNIIVETRGKEMSHGGEIQKFTTGVVKKVDPPVVKKSYPQGTGLQHTENTVNVNDFSKKEKDEMPDEHAQAPDKTDLRRLPDLKQDKDRTEYIANEISRELRDEHSKAFYYLVAAKIPEHVIRKALAEIREGGARSPARVFTSRIKDYAATTFGKQNLQNQYERQREAIGKIPFR